LPAFASDDLTTLWLEGGGSENLPPPSSDIRKALQQRVAKITWLHCGDWLCGRSTFVYAQPFAA
jgi:hypothetical protein